MHFLFIPWDEDSIPNLPIMSQALRLARASWEVSTREKALQPKYESRPAEFRPSRLIYNFQTLIRTYKKQDKDNPDAKEIKNFECYKDAPLVASGELFEEENEQEEHPPRDWIARADPTESVHLADWMKNLQFPKAFENGLLVDSPDVDQQVLKGASEGVDPVQVARSILQDYEVMHNFTEEQEDAFRSLLICALRLRPITKKKTFTPAFILTGCAGCGKTFLMTRFIDQWRKHFGHDSILVTSYFGSAAANIRGTTICSVLGVANAKDDISLLQTAQNNKELVATFQRCQVLVIDEFSTITASCLHDIDQKLRAATGKLDEPFGGVFVVFCGDPFQLPGVQGVPLWEDIPSAIARGFWGMGGSGGEGGEYLLSSIAKCVIDPFFASLRLMGVPETPVCLVRG